MSGNSQEILCSYYIFILLHFIVISYIFLFQMIDFETTPVTRVTRAAIVVLVSGFLSLLLFAWLIQGQ